MQQYKHLFFDLDHTLWDFDTNSRETLTELYEELQLQSLGAPGIADFLQQYYHCNAHCWALYRNGQLSKEVLRTFRFSHILKQYKIQDETLVEQLSALYLARCPHKPHLMPHAIEVLQHLQQKYQLHIITNGFKETQHIKLSNCDIDKYFQCIVTSEEAGALKPDSRIFHYSLKMAGAAVENSVYIGDHIETDVIGARSAGLDQVYYNPAKKVHKTKATFEVNCLSRLVEVFN